MDNKRRNNNRRNQENKGYDRKVVDVRRVAKVHKGGRRLTFSAMIVVGDKKGSVGVGLGKGSDTRAAIEKGERQALKTMTKMELVGDTIPHEVIHKKGAGKVLLRPARPGTGIIAGSSVRTVLELAGIESVYGKLLGSNDPIINAYCTFEALKTLRSGRVLERMSSMRDRLEMQKEIDKERQIKEQKKRKDKRQNNNRGRDSRKPTRRKSAPKKEVKKEVKKDKVSEKRE